MRLTSLRLCCAVALAVGIAIALAPPVRAQGSITDIQVEVTTALVQSSLTTEAIKKADDAKIRVLRARIDAQAVQVRAGRAEKADLIAENEALVAQLAHNDRIYAEAIEAFRGSVSHIVETPAGRDALAKYNAGDWAEAAPILDAEVQARAAARAKADAIAEAADERAVAALALDARAKGKESTANVIVRYEAVVKLDAGVFSDWVQLVLLYQAAGRHEDARRAADTAAKTADNDRDRAIADTALGDVLAAQGDLVAAGRAYQESLSLRRRVALADPNDVAAQRYVSVSLERTGAMRVAANDLPGALSAYKADLSVGRRLAAANPGNRLLQRDLAADLHDVGGVEQATGDLAGAKAAYHEMLGVCRTIATADPDNADAQRCTAIALEQVGDVLAAQHDLAAAVASYQESLGILRRLAAADPSNAQAQRGVAAGLGKIGDVLAGRGDQAGSLSAYQESLGIARRLAVADPTSAKAARDLLVALSNLAGVTGSGVRWSDVLAQLEAMDRRGILAPADRAFLDQARANAAAERR